MPTSPAPTTSSTSKSSISKGLAEQLAESQSATIYVEVEGLDDAGAAALISGDPPLHVEKDLVRDLWAVRKATDEEVAEAAAAAESAKAAPTSTSA
jgi:hypothetical protein